MLGIFFGKKAGAQFGKKMEVLGGIILIVIAFKILIEHLYFTLTIKILQPFNFNSFIVFIRIIIIQLPYLVITNFILKSFKTFFIELFP